MTAIEQQKALIAAESLPYQFVTWERGITEQEEFDSLDAAKIALGAALRSNMLCTAISHNGEILLPKEGMELLATPKQIAKAQIAWEVANG